MTTPALRAFVALAALSVGGCSRGETPARDAGGGDAASPSTTPNAPALDASGLAPADAGGTVDAASAADAGLAGDAGAAPDGGDGGDVLTYIEGECFGPCRGLSITLRCGDGKAIGRKPVDPAAAAALCRDVEAYLSAHKCRILGPTDTQYATLRLKKATGKPLEAKHPARRACTRELTELEERLHELVK
ncbi:MAG: hypothetical protein JNL38_06585 [Myxococcales bacterium]|nr:hypothetical protein [Myxococcales bacterium]